MPFEFAPMLSWPVRGNVVFKQRFVAVAFAYDRCTGIFVSEHLHGGNQKRGGVDHVSEEAGIADDVMQLCARFQYVWQGG